MSAIQGGGGNVEASAPSPSYWETFNIIRNPTNPSMVHIQARNGMYLQVIHQEAIECLIGLWFILLLKLSNQWHKDLNFLVLKMINVLFPLVSS